MKAVSALLISPNFLQRCFPQYILSLIYLMFSWCLVPSGPQLTQLPISLLTKCIKTHEVKEQGGCFKSSSTDKNKIK